MVARPGASSAVPSDRSREPASPGHPARRDWPGLAVGAAVTAAAGLLYWKTAARDIVVGDTPEFVTTAVTLGVAHPPGYPLVTLLGYLFSRLPVGPLPFRVNLLSVACGAAAVGLVYLAASRLTRDRARSAVAALALALSPLFWEWSLAAEVFALNNLLAAALVYLLIRWQERPERTRTLVGAAFVAGIAMTNQQTIVLLAPAVLFLLWQARAVLLARPRTIALCAVAILTGLLPYAYVPWAAARHPIVNWEGISSVGDLVDLFLRKSYGTGALVSSPTHAGGSPIDRVLALGASFGLLGGPLVVLGAVQAYRRRRWYFWFSLLAFVFAGPAFIAYANLNLAAASGLYVLERFFLLSHVVTAPLVALGMQLAGELLGGLAPPLRARAGVAVTGAVLLAAGAGALASYRAIDQSDNHVARNFAADILATLPPRTILLAGGDETVLPLVYLQAVEGHRPDVTLIIVPLLPADWYVRQLRERHPDLVLPFARHDGRSGTMKALVEANRDRPMAVVGGLLDESLKGSYWFYQRGLVAAIKPMHSDVKLGDMAAETERLLARYRPPAAGSIKPKSFERGILARYAAPAFRVGEEYEKAQLYATARDWYRRALAVDPDLAPARAGLARIEGK